MGFQGGRRGTCRHPSFFYMAGVLYCICGTYATRCLWWKRLVSGVALECHTFGVASMGLATINLRLSCPWKELVLSKGTWFYWLYLFVALCLADRGFGCKFFPCFQPAYLDNFFPISRFPFAVFVFFCCFLQEVDMRCLSAPLKVWDLKKKRRRLIPDWKRWILQKGPWRKITLGQLFVTFFGKRLDDTCRAIRETKNFFSHKGLNNVRFLYFCIIWKDVERMGSVPKNDKNF